MTQGLSYACEYLTPPDSDAENPKITLAALNYFYLDFLVEKKTFGPSRHQKHTASSFYKRLVISDL